MFNYPGQPFWGKDGKQYMIGAEKLAYPMGHNGANYEVRYIEYLDKHKRLQGGVPNWGDENWKIIGRYKASGLHSALAQGRQELQNRGI